MTPLEVVVARTVPIADGVREVTLVRPDGALLPAHPPGSHLTIRTPHGPNAYSLTSSGDRPAAYTIAVHHRGDGTGGSGWVHALRQGEHVEITAPIGTFVPIATARRHLLVAGGIGVTPLVAHARYALRWGTDVRMLYVHRRAAGAYADELSALLGERLLRTTAREQFQLRLAEALREQPLGTHLYVCGPRGLLDHVAGAAAGAGWPPQRVHTERFAAPPLDPGRRFTARLARSRRDVVVEPGVSLLDALRRAGVAVPSQCGQGVCGECRVPVVRGRPLHRDEYLSPDERRAGSAVLCCVSRSETEVLEVDL